MTAIQNGLSGTHGTVVTKEVMNLRGSGGAWKIGMWDRKEQSFYNYSILYKNLKILNKFKNTGIVLYFAIKIVLKRK